MWLRLPCQEFSCLCLGCSGCCRGRRRWRQWQRERRRRWRRPCYDRGHKDRGTPVYVGLILCHLNSPGLLCGFNISYFLTHKTVLAASIYNRSLPGGVLAVLWGLFLNVTLSLWLICFNCFWRLLSLSQLHMGRVRLCFITGPYVSMFGALLMAPSVVLWRARLCSDLKACDSVFCSRAYGAPPVNLNIKSTGSRPYGQGVCRHSFGPFLMYFIFTRIPGLIPGVALPHLPLQPCCWGSTQDFLIRVIFWWLPNCSSHCSKHEKQL